MMRNHGLIVTLWLGVAGILPGGIQVGWANDPVRGPEEDVKSPELRYRSGLHPDEKLLFNGWGITPAGEHLAMSDFALKLVVAPDRKYVLAVHGGFTRHGVTVVEIVGQRQVQFLPLPKSWNGLAFSRDGKQFFVSGGDSGQIHIFNYDAGKASFDRTVKPKTPGDESVFLGSMAMHTATGRLYVCDEANDAVWALNEKSLEIEAVIRVGSHPHTCLFGADRRHLYVSDWGGRTVSVVDADSGKRIREIGVGIRPNDMALAPDGRLFVACSGDNTVHVIGTSTVETAEPGADRTQRMPEGTREIISTALYPDSPEGSGPDAVAVSPDGHTLFVANADNNCVMVVDISGRTSEDARRDHESVSVVEGFIPTGWYPTALAVSPDNQKLLVANGKGLKSRANVSGASLSLGTTNKPPKYDYIGSTLAGSISFIHRPDPARMAAYTAQVRLNSAYTPEQFTRADASNDSVIPSAVGEPCPIKYVLYIIKENRTYDQIFGDFLDAQRRPAGNGDSNLVMYGENVTPNHHQLARDYVLLDNLYCNGEVSMDGHSWCDAAIATDYLQRSWVLVYSVRGRLRGNQEMEVPSAGYLWDLCKRHGVSFKNYGEGAYRVPAANRGRWGTGRDMDLVKGWIQDLQDAEKTGSLPRFTIMSLGEDHTHATAPGEFTPDASVGSNDLALGRIVEAASESRFWKEMAIFVIEDDAQDGPDHVDAHRTAGFVLSPYCKRGFVDSTLYTTASMVRTIELILGLPPLTQYDAGATPMFRSFQKTPIVDAYHALSPKVDLLARNTPKSPGAKQSARMNFRDYDLAPEDEVNRILWRVAKGPGVPYPAPIHRAIFPGDRISPTETN